MNFLKNFLLLITLKLLIFIYSGETVDKSHRSKYDASLFNVSHILRHSAKRHMLAHEVDSMQDEVTLASLESKDWPQSEALVISQFTANLKTDNHSSTSGISTEGSLPDHCHTEGPCNTLNAACIRCNFNKSCVYGMDENVSCRAKDDAKCQGSRMFIRTFNCRYCYQTPSDQHTCQKNTSCHVISAPRQRYIAKCIVKPDVLCLGRRVFPKNVLCNWTRGYSWSTALLLSIVFGGFGVDRFYLGMWQEGIGKLFSFGGLGVWTLVDVILIAAGYLGPADGSLYI